MQQMTTWLPRHRVMCRLTRREPDGATVVQAGSRVFFAVPEFALLPATPLGLVFYAIFTQDIVRVEDGGLLAQPRLLVSDVDVSADPFFAPHGLDMAVAKDRYEALRVHLGPRYLPLRTNKAVMLHWVGFFHSAHKVFEQNVGHEIEDLVCMGTVPGQLMRPMRINIPKHTVRFQLAISDTAKKTDKANDTDESKNGQK